MEEREVEERKFRLDPIMARFETQGDVADYFEMDVRRVRTWEKEGVPWHIADKLAVTMGLHPADIWGDEWWNVSLAEQGLDGIESYAVQDPLPGLPVPEAVLPPAANVFEARAREAKVAKLVEVAKARGLTRQQVEQAEVRDALVSVTGVRRPSETTWAVVADRLAKHEKAAG